MRKRNETTKADESGEKLTEAAKTMTEAQDVRKKREAAEETATKLKAELDKEKKRSPLDWDSANKATEAPVPTDMQRIIDAVFIDDPWPVYEKLEKALHIGEKRSDYGTTAKALDEAETNARLAHRLFVTAKVAREEWESENSVVFGAMRAQATAQLQREKDQGTRSKQITDADVTMMCAAMFQDEWTAQESRRRKFESMVDNMRHLSDAWLSRCKGVQTIHGKQR